MKHKKTFALVLTALIAVTALVTTACAATPDAKRKPAATETSQAAQHEKKSEKGSKSETESKKEKIAEPENAIGKDAAKEAALKDAGVTEDKVETVKARVTKLDDGTIVYKVGFTVGDKYYSYQINALTGAVVDKTEQSAEEHASQSNGKSRGAKAGDKSGEDASSGQKRSKGGKKVDASTGATINGTAA